MLMIFNKHEEVFLLLTPSLVKFLFWGFGVEDKCILGDQPGNLMLQLGIIVPLN
jgi:hypothetical protein